MRDDTPSFMGPALFFGLIIFVLAFEEAGPIYLNPQETMDLSEATGPMDQDRLAVSMPPFVLASASQDAEAKALRALPAFGPSQFKGAEAFTQVGWTQAPEGLSWRLTNFARIAEIGALPRAIPAVLHQGGEAAANQVPILTADAPQAAPAEPQVAALANPRQTVAGLFEAPELVGGEGQSFDGQTTALADPQTGADPAAPLAQPQPEALPQGPPQQVVVGVDPDVQGLDPRADPTTGSGRPGQGWQAPLEQTLLGAPVLAAPGDGPELRTSEASVSALVQVEGLAAPQTRTEPGTFPAETAEQAMARPSGPNAAPQDLEATYTPLLWRTVTGNNVNVRTAPTLEADVTLQIFIGYRVILIQNGPEFSLVNWPDPDAPFTGWVSNEYLLAD